MPDPPGIDVRDVSVRRGGHTILRDVSLTVRRGERVAMVGLNGAGKTTLLSVLATLVVPRSGRVFVDGVDALDMPARVRSRIGVVFQASALEPRMSVRDNLRFIAHCQGLVGRTATQRIGELLIASGLDVFAATPVQRLSGGQRRRLELARALIARPPILLLDEPTLGLDVAARRAFWSEIEALVDDGRTVLCSTHHTDEARDADRVVVLDRGAVLADGHWQQIRAPVPDTIRLQVPDVDEAHRWLAAQRHAVAIDNDSVVVSGTDVQAALPALLRRMPHRVLGVDVVAPDLMDLVGHWIDVRRRDVPQLDAERKQ